MAQTAGMKLSESLEDYLEAIFNLSDQSGITRAKDVAETLGVARSSVTGALRLLSGKGLVNYRPYDYITLTEQGAQEAERIARKHSILKSFFVDVMGVEPELAQQAACRTEHALGPTVISRLVRFVDFVMEPDAGGVCPADRFRSLCGKQRDKAPAKAKKWAEKKNRS